MLALRCRAAARSRSCVSLGLNATPTSEATPTLEPTPTIAASPTPALITIQIWSVENSKASVRCLKNAGFVVERQDQPSRSVPAGVIISQDPPPGPQPVGATIRSGRQPGRCYRVPERRRPGPCYRRSPAPRCRPQTSVGRRTGSDRLPDFDSIPPNQVVSATANGQPVQNGESVPRGATIVLGVRQP